MCSLDSVTARLRLTVSVLSAEVHGSVGQPNLHGLVTPPLYQVKPNCGNVFELELASGHIVFFP